MSERYWKFQCKECKGTGWRWDYEHGLYPCFEGDHAQLSVTAKSYTVDAWPMKVGIKNPPVFVVSE